MLGVGRMRRPAGRNGLQKGKVLKSEIQKDEMK